MYFNFFFEKQYELQHQTTLNIFAIFMFLCYFLKNHVI